MKRLFAVAALATALTPALALAQTGDAAKGAATFKMRCGICHTVVAMHHTMHRQSVFIAAGISI